MSIASNLTTEGMALVLGRNKAQQVELLRHAVQIEQDEANRLGAICAKFGSAGIGCADIRKQEREAIRRVKSAQRVLENALAA